MHRLKTIITLSIVLLIIIPYVSIGQSELKKYSYIVYLKTNKYDYYVGIGFFIKLNRDTYFITAKHVVSIPADTLYIVICDSCSGKNKIISIDISNVSKNVDISFGDTDIYVHKVTDKSIKRVNSIEKYIPNYSKKFDFNKVENIVFYGSPKTINDQPFNLINTFPSIILTEASLIGSYDRIRYSPTLKKYDSINYWAKAINNTFANKGDSGAPVFFKVGNKYYFGGMCISGVQSYNVISIVRPDKLIQIVSEKGKRKKRIIKLRIQYMHINKVLY